LFVFGLETRKSGVTPERLDAANGHDDGFAHLALLYAGIDDFVQGTAAFLRDGFEAGEPMLVAVSATKIDLLRDELCDEMLAQPDLLRFVDMAALGLNPARIIPAWRAFVDTHAANATNGTRCRGIGEPVWAERTPAELVECQRHESLLNVAFDGDPPWNLLCPYDTTTLAEAVIDEARRSHPVIVTDDVAAASDHYRQVLALDDLFGGELPAPSVKPDELHFETGSLAHVRAFVALQGEIALLGSEVITNLVLAVNELAANSLRHAGGRGTVRIWCEPDLLVCEVVDDGRILEPLVGRVAPDRDQEGGRGLWMVNHLCDLVQVRSTPNGNVVRISVPRPS